MFTKIEKAPIYQPYFKVLTDYANYAEVVSKCTRDGWMLKVEDGFIAAYHKPRGQKKYHYQERSATVSSAVKKIMKHDDYVKRFRNARLKIRSDDEKENTRSSSAFHGKRRK